MNDLENPVVDEGFEESAQDDAVQASQSDGTQAFSSLLEKASEEQNSQDDAGKGEEEAHDNSGGIRGRLLASEQKGYKRGQEEAQAAWQQERARYEERIAALEDLEIRDEAQKLAASEKISVSIAERIIRAERGRPAPVKQEKAAPQDTRPRDAQGRFVSQQSDVDAKAKSLMDQAQNITRMGGPDVVSIFNSDKEIQRRVASGEIDFYDLAREYGNTPRKNTPPVVPRTSSDGGHMRTVSSLTDKQFDELDRNLAGGAVYDMRR